MPRRSTHPLYLKFVILAATLFVLPLLRADLATLKRLSIEELLEMEVTSVSRAPEKLAETASAIQVLSSEDLRRSGATSLPESLRLANNLNVAQKNAHDWGISARGFNTDLANKLLVLIDGRTVYTPLFSGVRWDVQDYLLEDVDRIEVISGPGGALWGANAVNGVINVTTKSAKDTQGGYASAAAGTQLRQLFTGRYGAQLAPDVYYRVYVKHIERDDETLANGASANDARELTQVGFRVDEEKKADTLTFQGDYYQGKDGFSTGGKADVDGGNFLGRWTRTLSDGSDLKLQLYFDHAYIQQPFVSPFAPRGLFRDSLDTYDLDFQHRLGLGSANFVWGAGYRVTSDRETPAPGLAFYPANLRQELASAFGQVEIHPSANTSLTAGTKVEHNDYTGFEVEPNVRAQWKIDDKSFLWGAISRAVRTPSRIDRDLSQPATSPVILRGDGNFASETVVAYELGYRRQIAARLALSGATFYNSYDHIRSVSRTPITVFPVYFANDLEGHTYGTELTGTFQATETWRLLAAYTLLKSDIHVRPGGTDLNNALNENSDPQQQVSFRSSFDFRKDIEFDSDLRWVDTLHNNNNGAVGIVPSYFGLDLRLAWHVNSRWELSLVGQNLLDKHHPEFGTPSPTRVELNRGAYAKVSWRY